MKYYKVTKKKTDPIIAGAVGGVMGYFVGGPAGAALGFLLGAGISEAEKDKDNYRRRKF